MKTKHTAGPWELMWANMGPATLTTRTGYVPGMVFPNVDSGHWNNPEAVANLKLCAAAPELLEALQCALEWIDAVPKETQLPAMPGFMRDEVDSLINSLT